MKERKTRQGMKRLRRWLPALACLLLLSAGAAGCTGCSSCRGKEPAPESLSVEAAKSDLVLGERQQLTAVVTPEGAKTDGLTWVSSDTGILTVDGGGLVTAVGGGTASVTVTSGSLSASFDASVDDSRRMLYLTAGQVRTDENTIGTEWVYEMEVNGEPAAESYVLKAGDEIACFARFTEKDGNPDIGEASGSHTVTEQDLTDGFTVTMELTVTENGGRYKGQSGHFIVTFTFTAQ